MTSEFLRTFQLRFLVGLVLFLCSAPSIVQDEAPASPDAATHQPAPASPDSASYDSAATSTRLPAQRDTGSRISIDSESGDGIDSFFEFVSFSILLVLLIAAASVFAGGFAAVSIFLDTGCLRILIAALGWGIAVLSGLIIGLLMGAGFGGIQIFLWGGLLGGGFLYLAAWQQGHQRAQQLAEADRLTWKRTLTGGALVGVGVGSVANLARSAGALFKGGGGSFGGGGASGSFSGAQAAAAASAKGATTKGTAAGVAVLGAVDASDALPKDTSGDATVRAEPADAALPTTKPAASPTPRWRLWVDAAVAQWHRVRWYHGVAFVLISLIFWPVGMGISAILQSGNVLLGLALVGVCLWAFVQFMTTERYGDVRRIGIIVLLPLIAASIRLAGCSTAPYWHLSLVGAVVLVVVLYRSRRRSTSAADPDATPSFEGGSASDRW